MFNEYENDPDDELLLTNVGQGFIDAALNAMGDETNGEATIVASGTPQLFQDSLEAEITMSDVLEYLEGQRFEQDKIFYDISDADGTGYDQEGFVSKEFSFLLKAIDEVIAGRTALDEEVFDRGTIGIYADVIEDKVATGGDIASGEYTVYSTVGRLGDGTPSFKLEEAFNTSGYIDFDEFAYDLSSVKYNNLEEQAFFLKYAAVPGITESTFDDPVTGYLNDIFNTMALDVYNTVLTREYVPKLIKQERTSISAILSVSIGDESDPLESTIYESTTTFEEEA